MADFAPSHSPFNSMWNNPIGYSDPDGDWAWGWGIAVGAAFGFAAGVTIAGNNDSWSLGAQFAVGLGSTLAGATLGGFAPDIVNGVGGLLGGSSVSGIVQSGGSSGINGSTISQFASVVTNASTSLSINKVPSPGDKVYSFGVGKSPFEVVEFIPAGAGFGLGTSYGIIEIRVKDDYKIEGLSGQVIIGSGGSYGFDLQLAPANLVVGAKGRVVFDKPVQGRNLLEIFNSTERVKSVSAGMLFRWGTLDAYNSVGRNRQRIWHANTFGLGLGVSGVSYNESNIDFRFKRRLIWN